MNADGVSPSPGEARSLDPEAWVDHHGDALYRYALLRLRDPELASELVQETFLHAYRGRESYGGRASERTWLASILRHKLIDHFRRSGREAAGPGDEGIFDRAGRWRAMPGGWGANPAAEMERREFWACFEGCLARLPSNIADTFLLREVEDCGADDICEALQITPTNMHTRLYRARLFLQECLGSRWFGADRPKKRGRG